MLKEEKRLNFKENSIQTKHPNANPAMQTLQTVASATGVVVSNIGQTNVRRVVLYATFAASKAITKEFISKRNQESPYKLSRDCMKIPFTKGTI